MLSGKELPVKQPACFTPSPDKRIIKGRPFEVGFDRSHQSQQQGAPL
jgi:hypothetical protein